MRSRRDIFQDHPLEIAGGNQYNQRKRRSMVRQILKDGQTPGNVDPTITYKNCFLDPFHIEARTVATSSYSCLDASRAVMRQRGHR